MGRIAIVAHMALVMLLLAHSTTTASSAQIQYDRQLFRKPSSRDSESRTNVLQRKEEGDAAGVNSSLGEGEEEDKPVPKKSFQWTEKLFVAVTCVFVATVVVYYAVWGRVCC